MKHNSVLPDEIFVVGAGGHGKVAVRAAQSAGMRVAAIFDDDPKKWGTVICGATVVGPVESVRQYRRLPALLGIGDNARRLELSDRLDLPWISVVHPTVYVDECAQMGIGVLMLPGAIVHTDAVIGDHVIVNSKAIVEHDCILGMGAHVSCGACLTGGVEVGRGALIGAGATVLPRIRVADFARVGAGAVVTRDVPCATTVVGSPARILTPNSHYAA